MKAAVLIVSCKQWLPNPNLRKSSKQTIKHQIRSLAQVMAILELAKVSLKVLL